MLKELRTYCDSIDEMLGGGLPSGSVSLIYGEPETGKTTLAMQCAVNCAQQGYKTLLLDCDGNFSAQRLDQIAANRFKDAAEMIILMRPKDFREQADAIDRLTEFVTKSFGLVIIDSMTSLYRLRIAESPKKTFDFNRELNRQTAILAQDARIQKIMILLTSQVRTVFSETTMSIEPVATRVLKFWADIIIGLRPTEATRTIKAVLEKSPKGLPFHSADLIIDGTGIHDT